MFKNKFLISILGISFLLLTSFVLPTNAALVPCGRSGTSACQLCDFLVLGQNIIDFLVVQIAPALAVLMFAVGGIALALSAGKPAWQTWGKKTLTNAIIGVIIISVAWIGINTIINFVGGGSTPTGFPWPWNKVNC